MFVCLTRGQALMASEDKAHKALQEGIDADAQPAALLEELLKRHSSGEELKEACTAVLQKFPESEAMLNCKQTIASTASTAALMSSFSTPAPKVKTAAPASAKKLNIEGSACDETIAEDVGSACSNSHKEVEETVTFGAKLSAAKPGAGPSTVTPARSSATPKAPASSRATPNPPASSSVSSTPKPAASKREDTVTFGARITTPTATARAAAVGSDTAEGKAAAKKPAVRAVKRTGLGGGPARRVNPADDAAPDKAGDEALTEPGTQMECILRTICWAWEFLCFPATGPLVPLTTTSIYQ